MVLKVKDTTQRKLIIILHGPVINSDPQIFSDQKIKVSVEAFNFFKICMQKHANELYMLFLKTIH